ncbi:MAG: hypothetical protein IH945_00295 [Armatimonadetes bacterium]|nr:hypothetical protein [Armatimonadota bacterium]
MNVRVVDAGFRTKSVHTRIPFKFGVHVLRSVPLAELALTVESPARERSVGRASDLLVPKWFDKGPDSSPEQDSAALAESADAAVKTAIAVDVQDVFGIWCDVHAERVGTRDHRDGDALVRGFGVALVERALIDAVCRMAERPFHAALLDGTLGFDSGQILEETAAWSPERLGDPVRSIEVRHTVGMLDPLTVAEIPADEWVEDGLPQALEEDIAAYGVRWFKIKVCGDPKADAERLRDVARVAGEHARYTLDGNEQCDDLESLAGTLEDLRSDPVCRRLVDRIVLIEQPLPRRETFEASANRALGRLSKIAPVIIDEADTDARAFTRAIELGYAGVSVKACKGTFRALANRALIDVRGDTALFQSGEDLTNLGSIPLQQDLALQATLGMQHVERNGHHYFRGLDHLSEQTRAELVRSLPELYVLEEDLTRVRIADGRIDVSSVVDGAGLGGTLGSIGTEEN